MNPADPAPGVLVAYGTVTDTTAHPGWDPVRVLARLAEPVVCLAEHDTPLDGPASFAMFHTALGARVPLPPPGTWSIDFALPLATWTAPCSRPDPDPRLLAADGAAVWGWACSKALYTPRLHTAVHMRRRPAVAQMARYTTDRTYHAGLGPYKARSGILPAVVTDEIAWFALADADALRTTLSTLTHLGRGARHGHGRVLEWRVEHDEEAHTGWRRRSFPHHGGFPGSIRAPYWHPSRRMPCRYLTAD